MDNILIENTYFNFEIINTFSMDNYIRNCKNLNQKVFDNIENINKEFYDNYKIYYYLDFVKNLTFTQLKSNNLQYKIVGDYLSSRNIKNILIMLRIENNIELFKKLFNFKLTTNTSNKILMEDAIIILIL